MRQLRRFALLLCLALFLGSPLAAADCDGLEDLLLPDATITAVTELEKPQPHCKVEGRISHSIGFTVWLPHEWNGR